MARSTKTKVAVQSKVATQSKAADDAESILAHVIELNQSINYMMGALKTQANMLEDHQKLLDRVKIRMGL